MPQASLTPSEHGLLPSGPGWYILNAQTAAWKSNPAFGDFLDFEGDTRFPEFGLNIHVLQPGLPACKYHRESAQEGFLVLSGECIAIIQGEETPMKAWDYFHCPAGTDHVLVGAGDGPCAVLMIGARKPEIEITYPTDAGAAKYGASVDEETPDPRVAYEDAPPSTALAARWSPPSAD